MALRQWELYESMSVLKDSGTTICSVPDTGRRGAAAVAAVDGREDAQTATVGGRPAAAADGNGRPAAGEPYRCAAKKRPAANDPANVSPAQAAGGVERRAPKKINAVKENCNEDWRGEDECRQFLSSLLPYLRDVPRHRKLTVRHKLQKVFIDELDNADRPPRPPPPPPPPPPSARGPPPPYPHQNEFGGYVPPQHVYAAAGKPPAAADRPPKPHACAKHTASPQPAAGNVPLLNIDYTASMKPTVYYNSKAFAELPAARDMLCYGHGNRYAAADVRQADATPAPANAGSHDSFATATAVADAANDNPWTYCSI